MQLWFYKRILFLQDTRIWGSISTIYPFLEFWPMVDVIYPTVCLFFFRFFFCNVCRAVLVFFKCLINLTSFLFKSKFISFSICDFSHPLSHYYCCYNYHFYYYLLLIYIYMCVCVCVCVGIFYMFYFDISSHFHFLVMPRYL